MPLYMLALPSANLFRLRNQQRLTIHSIREIATCELNRFVITIAQKIERAQVIANRTQSHFETLSAVLASRAELKDVIDAALDRKRLYQRKTTLFVKQVLEPPN